jgi:hypothetical protein
MSQQQIDASESAKRMPLNNKRKYMLPLNNKNNTKFKEKYERTTGYLPSQFLKSQHSSASYLSDFAQLSTSLRRICVQCMPSIAHIMSAHPTCAELTRFE